MEPSFHRRILEQARLQHCRHFPCPALSALWFVCVVQADFAEIAKGLTLPTTVPGLEAEASRCLCQRHIYIHPFILVSSEAHANQYR
jgi:hypothetical protein